MARDLTKATADAAQACARALPRRDGFAFAVIVIGEDADGGLTYNMASNVRERVVLAEVFERAFERAAGIRPMGPVTTLPEPGDA